MLLQKGFRVALKGLAPQNHLHSQVKVAWRAHLHGQTKAIKQLGTQLAFFRVATAHQHKPRGMHNA